ncbi:hypothetical protein Tco_0391433 [Tanacetum coccineum]
MWKKDVLIVFYRPVVQKLNVMGANRGCKEHKLFIAMWKKDVRIVFYRPVVQKLNVMGANRGCKVTVQQPML